MIRPILGSKFNFKSIVETHRKGIERPENKEQWSQVISVAEFVKNENGSYRNVQIWEQNGGGEEDVSK